MGRMGGIRSWLLVGGGFGVLAAVFVIVLQGTFLALLLEAILAVGAGLLVVSMAGRAQAAAIAGFGPAPFPTRGNLIRDGALAGATMGVLAGIAFSIIQVAILNGVDARNQLASVIAAQGAQAQGISADTLLGITEAGIGCCYVLFIPAIMAGLGALGAWIRTLNRPLPAAPPPPPLPGYDYNLPPLPPTTPEDSSDTQRLPPSGPGESGGSTV